MGRTSAARAVNRDLVLLYWDLGRAIVEQQAAQGWGDSVVEQIAADLRRGVSRHVRLFDAECLEDAAALQGSHVKEFLSRL